MNLIFVDLDLISNMGGGGGAVNTSKMNPVLFYFNTEKALKWPSNRFFFPFLKFFSQWLVVSANTILSQKKN